MNTLFEAIKGFIEWALIVGGITLAGMATAGLLALVLRWWFEYRQK